MFKVIENTIEIRKKNAIVFHTKSIKTYSILGIKLFSVILIKDSSSAKHLNWL
ncbi:MAG: hypothetical protein JWM14_1504 [Chitinophagaceae bacterium]|nr:hypothetical protein [Chitinophagaceae bacterium]